MPMRYPLVSLLLLACLSLSPLQADSGQRQAGLTAQELRVCDKATPVGTEEQPHFGWTPLDPSRDSRQSAYRILVASSRESLDSGKADIWDSGVVESKLVNAIPYGGPRLRPATRYFWKVLLTDDLGRSSSSATAHFDTGLLTNEDWAGAQWIRRDSAEPNDYTLYRRSFELPASPVTRAILYLSACHKYELWVNGAAVGKGPAYHQPQYQYYNAYDVSALLKVGASNTLALFNRWWGSGQGRPKGERGMIAKLIVEHSDGTTTTLCSDGAWRQQRAEQWEPNTGKRNRTNGIGFIENIQASRITDGWEQPGFDDSGWSPVTVIGPHPTAPWKGRLQADLTRANEQTHEVTQWTRLGDRHYLADFGKVRAGYPAVDIPASATTTPILMKGGYTLLDTGLINPRTNQKTDLSYTFIPDGKPRQFRPAEYHGMRYLEIENAPDGLASSSVRFISRNYELDALRDGKEARFTSSHPMLNRVWDLMVDSIPVCTQEQFIDTPTREKGGFLNDAWSESVAAMLVARDRTMTRRVLEEYLDSQDSLWPEIGTLNDVYPYDNHDDIPDYTQAFLVWIWDYYMETGDRAFLEAQYGRLTKLMAYVMRSRNPETGLIHDIEGGKGDYKHGIIDWPKSMRYGYDMDTQARTVINAYAWLDLELMARIARLLERPGEAQSYAQQAEALKTAINTRLVTAEGLYSDGIRRDGTLSSHLSQQANMMPLAFGLVPESRSKAVLEHVKSLRMSCGMVTVRWLLEAIARCEDGEHLVELFTNETWDGWAKSLARGATCTWESWNAIDGTESLSHAWGAIGVLAYARHILGVEPLEPQHARIRIRPLLFGQALTQASGRLPTDRGDVAVSWRREGATTTMELDIPDSMEAELWVPAPGAKTLRAGETLVSARREGAYFILPLGPGRHHLKAE